MIPKFVIVGRSALPDRQATVCSNYRHIVRSNGPLGSVQCSLVLLFSYVLDTARPLAVRAKRCIRRTNVVSSAAPFSRLRWWFSMRWRAQRTPRSMQYPVFVGPDPKAKLIVRPSVQ